MSKHVCARCGGPAENGAEVVLHGPATGFNFTRWTVCEDCAGLFRWFMDPVPHVQMTDEVTPWGNAHIATCAVCAERFGNVPTVIHRKPVPKSFLERKTP